MLINVSNINNILVRSMILQTKTHPTYIRGECGLGVSAFTVILARVFRGLISYTGVPVSLKNVARVPYNIHRSPHKCAAPF